MAAEEKAETMQIARKIGVLLRIHAVYFVLFSCVLQETRAAVSDVTYF
jgi:hypothetical protein